jgi:hypothetical protein
VESRIYLYYRVRSGVVTRVKLVSTWTLADCPVWIVAVGATISVRAPSPGSPPTTICSTAVPSPSAIVTATEGTSHQNHSCGFLLSTTETTNLSQTLNFEIQNSSKRYQRGLYLMSYFCRSVSFLHSCTTSLTIRAASSSFTVTNWKIFERR